MNDSPLTKTLGPSLADLTGVPLPVDGQRPTIPPAPPPHTPTPPTTPEQQPW